MSRWRPARPSALRRPAGPTIEIIFTTTPQDLLDTVRKDDPAYLGYFTSLAQADTLAKVTRPIQAWDATTETTDRKGRSYP